VGPIAHFRRRPPRAIARGKNSRGHDPKDPEQLDAAAGIYEEMGSRRRRSSSAHEQRTAGCDRLPSPSTATRVIPCGGCTGVSCTPRTSPWPRW